MLDNDKMYLTLTGENLKKVIDMMAGAEQPSDPVVPEADYATKEFVKQQIEAIQFPNTEPCKFNAGLYYTSEQIDKLLANINVGGSVIPSTTTVEYSVNFQDFYEASLASKRYENSSYTDYKKKCLYMKYAILLAVQNVNSHGGGTIIFDRLYEVDGGVAAWEIDNVNHITFKGVGVGGFKKPAHNNSSTSSGYQRFGFIRHCNHLRFINMTFQGSQTDMPKLYAADYGVEIHGGEDFIFEECTFTHMNDACLVVGNETSMEANNPYAHFTKYVHVNKCKFIECWQTSTTQCGVYNYWFTNNYVKGGATKFAQRKPNGDNVFILNNVYEAHDSFIGNVIEVCNYDHVIIDNNIIKCGKNTACGISNYYNTHADENYYSTHHNFTITNNKIYNSNCGMWINHGISKYPAGKYTIENNTFESGMATKAIALSGYFEQVDIKGNDFKNLNGMGVCVGRANSNDKINVLNIVNNSFVELSKMSLALLQSTDVLRINNNTFVNKAKGMQNVIKFGDGNVVGSSNYLEFKGNYVNNTIANTSVIGFQGVTLPLVSFKDNTILVANGNASYGMSIKKGMFTGNIIQSSGQTIHLANANGSIYTANNMLSKDMMLNGNTEIKM